MKLCLLALASRSQNHQKSPQWCYILYFGSVNCQNFKVRIYVNEKPTFWKGLRAVRVKVYAGLQITKLSTVSISDKFSRQFYKEGFYENLHSKSTFGFLFLMNLPVPRTQTFNLLLNTKWAGQRWHTARPLLHCTKTPGLWSFKRKMAPLDL